MADFSVGKVIALLFNVFLCYVQAFIAIFFPPLPKHLRGKKVLITGAAGGIGLALAKEFYKFGCVLVLWDLDKEKLETLAKQISTNDKTVFPYVCDVTNKRHVKDTAEKIRQEVGEIDILVNNAGVWMQGGEFLRVDKKIVKKTFKVNVLSMFTMIQEFVPSMVKRNSGSIVSMSSAAGLFGVPLMSEYSASKHAVVGMHESLSLELRRYGKTGISTHLVCPGFIKTPLITHSGVTSGLEVHSDLHGVLEPEAVAVAVVDGIRRDRRKIWVPKEVGLLRLMDLIFPDKAKDLLYRDGPKLGIWSKDPKSCYD